VLEELALARLVAKELALRSMSIDEAAVERERAVLLATMTRGVVTSSEQATEVVERVRRSRGLGEKRFRALLVRNAALRALVKDEVQVSPTDLDIAYQIRHGERFRTRLILTQTEREAAAAVARLKGTDGKPPEAFASVAAQLSTDASSGRGGMIGLVSAADPSYPDAVRRAVINVQPGSFSEPIALDQGYAIIGVDEVVPATGAVYADVSAGLEKEVREVREQVAMNKLAQRLLRSITVTPLDGSLNWGWKAWRELEGE